MLPAPTFPVLRTKLSKLEALPHQERVADKLKHEDTPGLLAYHGLGSGKTFTSIHAADTLHMPILAIVPAPLRPNYHKELAKAGFKGQATVVSYDEALRRMNEPDFRNTASKALVVYDECFAAGTLVDGKPIETLKVGDVIPSFDCETMSVVPGVITALFKKKAIKVARVSISGFTIVCSLNHPFATTAGWVSAKNLAGHTVLVTYDVAHDTVVNEVPCMSEVRRALRYSEPQAPGELSNLRESILQPEVLPEYDGSIALSLEPEVCVSSNDKTQSNALEGMPRAHVSDAPSHRMEATYPRRERDRTHGGGTTLEAGTQDDGNLCLATCPRDGERSTSTGVSEELQNRSGDTGGDDCDRGGREVTFTNSSPKAGCQENGFPRFARVDRVEILELTSAPECEHLCPGSVLYNIEVSPNRTYIVNGVIVHNSHRMGHIESQRAQLAGSLPARKKLLLTGTPIRNDPTELAPLINAVKPGALPLDPAEFRERYIHTREVPVGFWGRIVGAKPGKLSHPVNLDHFRKMVRGAVDYHQAQDRSAFPSSSEHIIEVPMSSKQQAAYDFTLGRYPALAYKIAHGLPMHRSEETNFRAFMIGPRQISNHPGGFNVSAKDSDAHKIRSMAEHIEKRYKADKHFRGVSYSSFLDAGVHPLARELKRRGIPHAIFTGSVPDEERKHIVENYNKGKVPVLIISGAGAEGLDLKGTKLMQIAEPHWQEEMINQVRGRAIRFHSHTHLPENERHVEVQRFHSIPRPSFFEKLLGRKRSRAKGVDEYIHQNAVEKQHINAPFLNILKEESEPAKAAALLTEEVVRRVAQEAEQQREPSFAEGPFVHHYVLDNQRHPALLVDLDGTLVVTDGSPGPQKAGQQKVLPRRLEILRKLKKLGYKIIGITNRSLGHIPSSDSLQATIEEVFSLFPDLLDDIIYAPSRTNRSRPSGCRPTSLRQPWWNMHSPIISWTRTRPQWSATQTMTVMPRLARVCNSSSPRTSSKTRRSSTRSHPRRRAR